MTETVKKRLKIAKLILVTLLWISTIWLGPVAALVALVIELAESYYIGSYISLQGKAALAACVVLQLLFCGVWAGLTLLMALVLGRQVFSDALCKWRCYIDEHEESSKTSECSDT